MIFSEAQLRIMENMGSAPKQALPKTPMEMVPKDHVKCACFKKNIHVSEIHYHSTGVTAGVSDSLCAECMRMVPNHCLVVCVVCKAVVARMAPQTDKSGFVFKPRSFYHTNACPGCKPGLVKSILIEKELFDRDRRK